MRKGQASLVIMVALILALMLTVGFWLMNTGENISKAEDLEYCIRSIEANSNSRQGAHVFADSIKCPAKQVSLDKENHKITLRRVANEQVECHKKFIGDKGKELFESEAIFCAVCSVIDFEESGLLSGYTNFIGTNNVIGKKISILNYLQGRESPTSPFNEKGQETSSDVIDMSKEYATIFVHARGEDKIQDFMKRAETSSGMIVAGAGMTSAGAGLVMVFLIGSNPVGWAVFGAGVVVGGAAATYNYFFEEGQETQWMSETFLVEYTGNTFDTLGCEVLPVEQGNI